MSASSVETGLQQAVTTALAADPAVKTILGEPARIFAQRPRTVAYPFASWGRVESLARDAEGASLTEIRLTLEVWCRDSDPAAVLGVLRQALRRADINLPEPVRLVSLVPAYSDIFSTRNARLRRGIIRLRALVGLADTAEAS